MIQLFPDSQYQNITSLRAMKISRGGIPRRRDRVPCGCYTTWLQEAPPLSSSPRCQVSRAFSPSPCEFRPTMADKTEVRAQVMLSVRKQRQLGDVAPLPPAKKTHTRVKGSKTVRVHIVL